MSWRDLSDADREREYSPSSCVGGDISGFLADYASRSADARRRCLDDGRAITEVRYGTAPTQTVDLVMPRFATSTEPLLVFLHGGYWQELSKRESFFGATGALDHGVGYAAVDYTLAPAATLDEIVEECRSALRTLVTEAADLGIDADRIVVAGSSAGAHLSAMVGLGVHTPDGALWRPAAVVLVSGIYELEPLIGTSINAAVGLDREAAQRNSPMFAELAGFPSALVTYGDNETDEFKRQSHEFANGLADAGVDAHEFEAPDRNHFDIVLDLCDRDEHLGQLVLNLVDAL